MSLSLLSDLSQLPYLSSQPQTHARTHLPCARKTPHRRHFVLLPLCPVLQPQETRKGTPASSYFPGEDEIEAGCRHTHLRRLSREFPAKPRRVGRRPRYQSLRLVDFRRPPRLSRHFPAKPRRVRCRVRGNYSGVSVFASCVTFRRRSTDIESRHTIPASRHFRIGIFESSW
ncbi:uncharacterized protein LOC126601843 isoform X3 [Malus sylvestris]|uniref:uncharacterized protein LOC126601843 isoform X3 n=1 Tax=Malus sylvestris TaxID=3752 RepID=UPI0021AC40DF|nr:uncharacterized protein LOC126601843 isoform X3 [Malus sylvestris]